jgi:hypothetical protein
MRKTPHLVVSLGVACTPGPDPPEVGRFTIHKIIHLNRLARQSTLPGKKFDQIPLNPETDPILRQSLLRSNHFAEVNHGQTEPFFCVPQFE